MLDWLQALWNRLEDGVIAFAAFLLAAGIILSRSKTVRTWWSNMRLKTCPNRDMVVANFGETIISRCEKALHDDYLPPDMRNRVNLLWAIYKKNNGNGVVVEDYVTRALALPEDAPDYRDYEGPERRKHGVHI